MTMICHNIITTELQGKGVSKVSADCLKTPMLQTSAHLLRHWRCALLHPSIENDINILKQFTVIAQEEIK